MAWAQLHMCLYVSKKLRLQAAPISAAVYFLRSVTRRAGGGADRDAAGADALRVDELCHRTGIGLVRADIRGVFARVFCDFGPAFTVFDVDGPPCTVVVRVLK